MVKCPKCETAMRNFSELRSRRIPHSEKFEKILVTCYKCPKCGSKRPKEETPLQKEKPRESKNIIVHLPPEILSQ
jgi:C4-type Zn-finger protein